MTFIISGSERPHQQLPPDSQLQTRIFWQKETGEAQIQIHRTRSFDSKAPLCFPVTDFPLTMLSRVNVNRQSFGKTKGMPFAERIFPKKPIRVKIREPQY